jgi:hypothetical protein
MEQFLQAGGEHMLLQEAVGSYSSHVVSKVHIVRMFEICTWYHHPETRSALAKNCLVLVFQRVTKKCELTVNS